MNPFKLLQIEETEDSKLIKLAYSKQLKLHSPEKDPDGFQKINQAYKEAIKKAKASNHKTISTEDNHKSFTPEDDYPFSDAPHIYSHDLTNLDDFPMEDSLTYKTAENTFVQQLEIIYGDFNSRLNVDLWTKLLQRDVCYNIDTSFDTLIDLLYFLNTSFYIPSEIWRLLDKHLHILPFDEAIFDYFSEDFLSFVSFQITHEDTFDYPYLALKLTDQADTFIKLYFTLEQALKENNYYQASRLITEAEALCDDHPNLLILKAQYLSKLYHIDQAIAIYSNLILNHHSSLLPARAKLYLKKGQVQLAFDDFTKALSLSLDKDLFLYDYIESCFYLGHYDLCVTYASQYRLTHSLNPQINHLLDLSYQEQIKAIESLIPDASVDINSYYQLANAYFETNKINDSLTLTLSKMPKNDFSLNYAKLYLKLLIKKEWTIKALDYASLILDHKVDDLEAYLIIADLYSSQQLLDQALLQYNKILKLYPPYHDLYIKKASILIEQKKYNDALKILDMALTLDASSSTAYVLKSKTLLYLLQFEDSLEASQIALSLDSQNPDAYLIKMNTYYTMRLYIEASTTFDTAIENGIVLSDLHALQHGIYRDQGKYKESLTHISHAIELDNKSDYHVTKGFTFIQLDMLDHAIDALNQAITIEPNNYLAHLNRGIAYSKTKKLELVQKSIEEFTFCIQLNSKVFEPYLYRAIALMQLGSYTEALMDDLAMVISLDPQNVTAYSHRINIYISLHQYQNAMNDLILVHEIIPYDQPTIDKIASLEKLMKTEGEDHLS